METTFIAVPQDELKSKKKSTYKEMFYRLSVHGALDFYESHTWALKFIWAIVIISALILATIEIYLTFDTYINSPILTSYTVVPKNELKFPQVYVCPMNTINKNNVKPFQLTTLQTFFAMTKDKKMPILSKINRNTDLILTTQRQRVLSPALQKTIMETMEQASLNESEFVKECAFHRKPIECSMIVQRMFDSDYGQCFLFAFNVTQKVSGYGLTLALDIRSDLYHPSLIPPFDGLKVCIMTKYDPGGSYGEILVKPGEWTKISLHPRHYKLINMDTGKVKQVCINSAKDIEYEVINYNSYSVYSCKLDCAQRISLKYCSCVVPMELEYLQHNYHNVTCSFVKMDRCFYEKVMKNHSDEIANCSVKCVAKCDYWEYTKTMSTIGFNEANFQKYKDIGMVDFETDTNETNKDRWIKDTVILDISFSDLIYTEIVQSTSMTVDTLLGNIGGQVGLWMGVSAISVIQVLMIAICYCIENVCKKGV